MRIQRMYKRAVISDGTATSPALRNCRQLGRDCDARYSVLYDGLNGLPLNGFA